MDVATARNGFLQKAKRVLYLAEEKRAALRADGADQWQALSLARFHMLRGLNELVLYKEDQVLLPILMASPAGPTGFARRLKDENLELQREYDIFVHQWGLRSAPSVTDDYNQAALAMMQHIEQRVMADMVAVNDLLDQVQAAG